MKLDKVLQETMKIVLETKQNKQTNKQTNQQTKNQTKPNKTNQKRPLEEAIPKLLYFSQMEARRNPKITQKQGVSGCELGRGKTWTCQAEQASHSQYTLIQRKQLKGRKLNSCVLLCCRQENVKTFYQKWLVGVHKIRKTTAPES